MQVQELVEKSTATHSNGVTTFSANSGGTRKKTTRAAKASLSTSDHRSNSSAGAPPSSSWTVPEICASVQETIFSMLVEITERAMAHTGSTDVLLVGGVGCNRRLQQMMQCMVQERQRCVQHDDETKKEQEKQQEEAHHRYRHNGRVGEMDHRYCVDNGAMIAQVGMLMYQYSKNKNDRTTTTDARVITPMEETWCTQRFRTDQVPAIWRK